MPKFIERQPVIIWRITFKQFIFLVMTGGVLGMLYLILPSKLLFYIIALFTGILAFALVFVRIGGRPLPIVLWNFINYLFGAKLYLWQRKAAPKRLLKKVKIEEEKPKEVSGISLKITEKSYLQEMARKIETGA